MPIIENKIGILNMHQKAINSRVVPLKLKNLPDLIAQSAFMCCVCFSGDQEA